MIFWFRTLEILPQARFDVITYESYTQTRQTDGHGLIGLTLKEICFENMKDPRTLLGGVTTLSVAVRPLN